MLRSVRSQAGLAILMACIMGTSASAATPLVLPHQGRLLDGSDAPLSGSYTIVYSIFDVPTGGSPLWTESHVGVAVSDGLFSVQLGSVVPLTADILTGASENGLSVARYLEMQLSGQPPISPRTQLASSPYAVAASRIAGDIVTRKGLAEIRDFSSGTEDAVVVSSSSSGNSVKMVNLNGLPPGEPVIGTLSMATTPTNATLSLGDLDGDGLYQVLATADSVVREITVTDNGPGGVTLMKAKEKANRTKCSNNLRAASLSVVNEIDNSCDLTHATMKAIQTKGTGAIASVRMDAGDSVGVTGSSDVDGDGHAEAGFEFNVLNSQTGFVDSRMSVDSDDDGVADRSVTSSCDASHAKIVLDRDTGRSKASMRVGSEGPQVALEDDSDGDGIAENSVVTESSASGASQRVVSLNGLPPGTPVIGSLSMATTPASSSLDVGDIDGDGVYRLLATADSVVREITVTDNGPIGTTLMKAKEKANRTKCSSNLRCLSPTVSNEIDESCDTTGSQLVVSGTSPNGGPGGAAKTATLSVSASPGGSACRAIATKGNGQTLRSTFSATDANDAQMLLEADTDGDGVYENTVTQTCDATSSRQIMAGTTSLAGSGGASHVSMEASPTGSSLSLDKGDVLVSIEAKDDSPGNYTGDFKITVIASKSPGLKVSLGSDGIGYLSDGLGVGVVAPTHHIDVVGGAYCDGTNWVNASDKNSKENFAKVDGGEILEKISELEITKWNYKGNDDAQHIGPTAQDFKKTFGVGADDKSISTIDPSGIALAAIKELYSQLKSKDKEMDELRSELAKLKKEMAKKN